MVEEVKAERAARRRRARRTHTPWGLVLVGVLAVAAAAVAVMLWITVPGSGLMRRLSPTLGGRSGGTEARLYFPDPRWSKLVLEVRRLPLRDDEAAWLRALVEALAEGPGEGGAPVVPRGTRVLGSYLGADGLAVIDLDLGAEPLDLGGAGGELGAVSALVHTVADNLPGVQSVQILVGGETRKTLAGHVKISEPLTPHLGGGGEAEP